MLRIPTQQSFYARLLVICLVAVAFRFAGVGWLSDAAPHAGFSFHPDVMRFITPTEDFRNLRVWRGYPLGLTSQLFILLEAFRYAGLNADPATVIRGISLGYGILTIFLAGVMARYLSGSTQLGLLTALLLTLAPLHIINSHFGTPDGAAAFFLYLTLLFGWRTLAHQRELDFVLFVTSLGLSLAMKFYFPLFVPLAIVIWQQRHRWERALLAGLVLAGSFSIANFFNYSPWDLRSLLVMLLEDNVEIIGAYNPAEQAGLYAWTTIRALGLGTWVLFCVGLGWVVRRGWRPVAQALSSRYEWLRTLWGSPSIVPVSAFVAYAAALLVGGLNAPRHLLPFVPLMCFVAAIGLRGVLTATRGSKPTAAAVLVALLAYQVYNAVGVENQYRNDIRNVLATEIESRLEPTDEVVTFSRYAQVRGARLADDSEASKSDIDSEYFVTCDMEFARYLGRTDAADVYHAFGGQARLEFYRDLFADRLDYRVVFDIERRPKTVEERLAARGVLSSLGEMLPDRCLLFGRAK